VSKFQVNPIVGHADHDSRIARVILEMTDDGQTKTIAVKRRNFLESVRRSADSDLHER
jgi:hypothetical protein